MDQQTTGLASINRLAKDQSFTIDSSAQPNNATSALIDRLILQTSQQHRTAVIVVASFSVLGALCVVASILYDTYVSEGRRAAGEFKKRRAGLKSIHIAEILPLLVSVAVIVQGTIFITVQGVTLSNLNVEGCTTIAQLFWPAIWLFALVVLVFGVETAFRSLLGTRFRARKTWATPVCVALVVVVIIGLWLVTFLLPAIDRCEPSLIWRTQKYCKVATAIASMIILGQTIAATVISIQLRRTINVDRDERIAATRVVYTSGISIIILVFVLPYYVQVILGREAGISSRLADIFINLGGFLSALVHLFLRTNSERTAIRPANAPWTKQREIRLFGPNDLNMGRILSTPLFLERNSSQKKLLHDTQHPQELLRRLPVSRHPRIFQAVPCQTTQRTLNGVSPITSPDIAQRLMTQRRQYSIFPSRPADERHSEDVARYTSNDENIQLPPPLFTPGHQRHDSEQSSATVQFALRLSQLPDQASLDLPYPTSGACTPFRMTPLSSEELLRIGAQVHLNPSPPLLRNSSQMSRQSIRSAGFDRLEVKKSRRITKSLPPSPLSGGEVFSSSQSHPPEEETWPLPSSEKAMDGWV